MLYCFTHALLPQVLAMFKSKEAELRLQEADKVKGLYRRQDLRFLEKFFPFFFIGDLKLQQAYTLKGPLPARWVYLFLFPKIFYSLFSQKKIV